MSCTHDLFIGKDSSVIGGVVDDRYINNSEKRETVAVCTYWCVSTYVQDYAEVVRTRTVVIRSTVCEWHPPLLSLEDTTLRDKPRD